MHDVPGRIYVVIVVASVGHRRAGLPRKTDRQRRSLKGSASISAPRRVCAPAFERTFIGYREPSHGGR